MQGGRLVVVIAALPDTVFEAASFVMVQERIALRAYEPQNGHMETDFIDLARYPAFFDTDLWDNTERLVKLRFSASLKDNKTVLMCEPLYNPYEVFTDETDHSRLRLVPPGHPGFDIAGMLTRRIAARAEDRAVTGP